MCGIILIVQKRISQRKHKDVFSEYSVTFWGKKKQKIEYFKEYNDMNCMLFLHSPATMLGVFLSLCVFSLYIDSSASMR